MLNEKKKIIFLNTFLKELKFTGRKISENILEYKYTYIFTSYEWLMFYNHFEHCFTEFLWLLSKIVLLLAVAVVVAVEAHMLYANYERFCQFGNCRAQKPKDWQLLKMKRGNYEYILLLLLLSLLLLAVSWVCFSWRV